MIQIKAEIPEVTIVAHLGNYCNYNCSYCSQKGLKTLKEKEKEHQEILKLYKNLPCRNELKYWIRKAQTISPIHLNLNFYGGEASEYTVEQLFQIYQDIDIPFDQVTITTNFSKAAKYYLTLNKMFKEHGIRFRVFASYHEEYQILPLFCDKFNYLLNEGIPCYCQFTLTNQNKELIPELANRIPVQTLNLELCFNSANGENQTIPLTPETEKIYFAYASKTEVYNEEYIVFHNSEYLGKIKAGTLRYYFPAKTLDLLGSACLLKNIEIQETGKIDKRCCLSMNNMASRVKSGLRQCICQRQDCRNLNFLILNLADNKLPEIQPLLI